MNRSWLSQRHWVKSSTKVEPYAPVKKQSINVTKIHTLEEQHTGKVQTYVNGCRMHKGRVVLHRRKGQTYVNGSRVNMEIWFVHHLW